MEDKKQPASPSPPASSSSSSLVADLFGSKDAPNPSPDPLHSVFNQTSTVTGRDSTRSDIFRPPEKHEAENQTRDSQKATRVGSTSVSICPEGTSEVNGHREKNSSYQQEKIDPCSFSSSLYYGGQDLCFNVSNLHDSDNDYKKDGEDDLNNPNSASRGNWWQGSLYY